MGVSHDCGHSRQAWRRGWTGGLLQAAKAESAPIVLARLDPAVQRASKNLYLLLSQKLQGKAATLCQLVLDGCGFEVWRLLFQEYKPAGAEPQHAMLEAIVQPKWWNSLEHRNRIFLDVLCDWEMLIARYTQGSGEVISDSIRCATVLGYADKVIATHLRGAQPEVRRNFAVMKVSIRELLAGQQGVICPTRVDAVRPYANGRWRDRRWNHDGCMQALR